MAPPREPPKGEHYVPPKKKPGDPRNTGAAPPPPDTGASEKQKFLKWAKAVGFNDQTARNIWFWSGQPESGAKYGRNAFAYYWAAVLLTETNGRHTNPDGTIKDSGQALGIGQISKGKIGTQIPWEAKGIVFTDDDNARTGIRNYGVNLRFSGVYLAQGVGLYGYGGAYEQHYNPNADASALARWNRFRGRIPRAVDLSPSAGPAPGSPSGTSPYPTPGDPFIAGVNKQGKFVFTPDPNKAIKSDGSPVTRSFFLRAMRDLDETFINWTGERPNKRQIMNFLMNGWSVYYLTTLLSGGVGSPEQRAKYLKKFQNSPIWKKLQPGYAAAAENLLDPGEKLDPELVRQAIVNNWDGGVFQSILRKRPQYVASNEFVGKTATYSNIYETIYGRPDQGALRTIQQAVIGGWSEDQFHGWLRSQDEYQFTPEYRDKAFRLVEALGFMTGQVPTLTPGVAPTPPSPNSGLPTDPRITGAPTLPTGPYFTGDTLG